MGISPLLPLQHNRTVKLNYTAARTYVASLLLRVFAVRKEDESHCVR